jgi:hypothetical protein
LLLFDFVLEEVVLEEVVLFVVVDVVEVAEGRLPTGCDWHGVTPGALAA